jgi:nitrogen-specific signal transduction histidine kinase
MANRQMTKVITIIRDITDSKQAQMALEDYSQDLKQMVEMRTARIAHEINNPIGGIKNSFLLVRVPHPPTILITGT